MLKYLPLILIFFSDGLFAQSPPVDPACTPAVSITESQNNICTGTAITFHATVANGGTSGVYKWKKNNRDAGVEKNADYTSANFRDGDIVVCEFTCKTACGIDTTVVSNPITVHVINDITPTVVIANNDPLICEGNLTVFTATASYGNAVPSYQWIVNGNKVGTNSPVFSTYTLTSGSKIQCVLTASTPSCPGTSKSDTSTMAIYVYPMIHPAIEIKASKTQICRGEEVTFTAKANGGAYPRFAWTINGISTGPDAPSLITTGLHDGDKVSCMVTIDQDSRCHTSTSAPSNEVVIHVRDFTDPTLKIASPTPGVCKGTPVTFTATPQNAGDYKSYQWQVNGVGAGDNSSSFIYDRFANGDKVVCTLSTDIPGCTFTATVTSNTEVVTVRSLPEITFSPPEMSVMRGESAQLQASVSGGTVSAVWRPEAALLTPQSLTSLTVPLIGDAAFKLSVTDSNGCTASKELLVKVLNKINIPSAFTPNNDGKNDVFRIPPDASVSLHDFSIFDRWGNIVFKTTDIAKGWNGTFNGRSLDTGTYVYFIKGIVQNKEVLVKGTVALVR